MLCKKSLGKNKNDPGTAQPVLRMSTLWKTKDRCWTKVRLSLESPWTTLYPCVLEFNKLEV